MDLAGAFRFELFEEHSDVFKHGDKGECFYVIIKGRVGVHIPNPKIKNWKAQRIEYHGLILWVKELENQYFKLKI